MQIEEANEETSSTRWLYSILTPLKNQTGSAIRRVSDIISAEEYRGYPASLERFAYGGLTDELGGRNAVIHSTQSTSASATNVQFLDEQGNPHHTECNCSCVGITPKLKLGTRDSDNRGYHAHAGGPMSRSTQSTSNGDVERNRP